MSNNPFHHPHNPYDVQIQLMNAIYDCLDHSKIGIFESPTGTGKSLSILCSALTWLRDYKRRKLELISDDMNKDGDDDEPDWIVEHERRIKFDRVMQARKKLEERLAKIRRESDAPENESCTKARLLKRQRVTGGIEAKRLNEEFDLDDYESEGENGIKVVDEYTGLSSETVRLFHKLGMSGLIEGKKSVAEDDDFEDNEGDDNDNVKIIYCTRTHSQLTQLADEVKKITLPTSIPADLTKGGLSKGDNWEVLESIKYLTLGSRKNLCVNKSVACLKSSTAINEKCKELQRGGKARGQRCMYMPTKENEPLVKEFRDRALASVRDIEDLGKIGQRLGICGYYASRDVIKYSEIVSVPYALLFQSSAREALSLVVKGNVVIIDEAHNLIDAIRNAYSASITMDQVRESKAQLKVYLGKYGKRLSGKNKVYITQLARILNSLDQYLQGLLDVRKASEGVVSGSDLLKTNSIDQINLYKLIRYLKESGLARKVNGYVETVNVNEKSVTTPVLYTVESFLLSLLNTSQEGRWFYSRSCGNQSNQSMIILRYMLLDASNHFKGIVEQAKSVVMIGGTMSPMEDYTRYLMPYVEANRIVSLSCGHVVPSDHVSIWSLACTDDGHEFDFTFGKRESEINIEKLGLCIAEITLQIPDGVVIFFPSYAYMESCVNKWKKIGSPSIYDRLCLEKPIIEECENSGSVAATTGVVNESETNQGEKGDRLTEYKRLVDETWTTTHRGAILFAVIGGSLSEGINFGDAYGRCVIVIGLPFPNPHSAEWKAKMEYIMLKSCASQEEFPNPIASTLPTEKSLKSLQNSSGKQAARDYYDNCTMRAVNQAIGRVIRHSRDYATIILIDKRYTSQRIRCRLPGWMKASVKPSFNQSQILREVDEFFHRMTSRYTNSLSPSSH